MFTINELCAFVIYILIYLSVNKIKYIKSDNNIVKKFNDYKTEKFYENTYLFHIPNSRIYDEIHLLN